MTTISIPEDHPADELADILRGIADLIDDGMLEGYHPRWTLDGRSEPEPDSARIFQALDLCTSHLPRQTLHALNSYGGVIARPFDYGAWMWVPDDVDAHLAEQEPDDTPPDEVVAIYRYARARGCDWVLFDRDARPTPDLPTWEW